MSRRRRPPPEPIEDEYSYPPEHVSRPVTRETLQEHGVRVPPRKGPAPTTRIYDKPLDDAAIARIRERIKRSRP